jgi:HSP20 family protein
MLASFSDPFEALFALQRALDARVASDWMGRGTAASGSFPPINIFQKGEDFVAVVELSGVDKNDLEIEAKENTIRIRGKKTIPYGEQASVHRRERISGVFDRTRYQCQFGSDLTESRPNMSMACLRCSYHERKSTSLAPSRSARRCAMPDSQELQVQQKRAVERKTEGTTPARVFVPVTDIFETPDALTVVLEMPGVDRNSIEANVEDDVITIEGRIDFTKYEGMQPVDTEYNVGHYARSFEISDTIDQSKIGAQMKDGVVTIVLPKAEQAKPRKIQVS